MITERERQRLDEEELRLLSLFEKEQHPALLNEVDQLAKAGSLTAGVMGIAALSLSAVERYEEAAKAAAGALEQEPGWAWLHAALATAQAGRGQMADAEAAQRRAAQVMAGEPAYAAGLAMYLRQSGDVKQAARVARQALMLDPAHAGALTELGLALWAEGSPAEALTCLRQAQTAAPEGAEAFVHEGRIHLSLGDRPAARAVLRAALVRAPGLPEAENRMAESLAGGPVRGILLHLLNLGRITLVGWLIIAFLYYLLFRFLEFLWKWQPATLPAGKALLLITLSYLLGGALLGHLLRWCFRTGWPR